MAVITVEKKIKYLGHQTRRSAKGNDYGVLNGLDEVGNTHRILVKTNDLPTLETLKQYDDYVLKVAVTYGTKYDKIELLRF